MRPPVCLNLPITEGGSTCRAYLAQCAAHQGRTLTLKHLQSAPDVLHDARPLRHRQLPHAPRGAEVDGELVEVCLVVHQYVLCERNQRSQVLSNVPGVVSV